MPLVIFSFFVLCSLFFAAPVRAITNPLQVPNNVYGIHIIDENDLEDAARLVNSNGGEWGYVTIVIREDDRDKSKWQKTFDRMREMKLIPLVRLATRGAGENWEKPRAEEVDAWVDFLGSLNWVIQNRYVILFNEPNHAQEWGGSMSPEEYAKIVREFYNKLKARSEDFFILPAGFDTLAPDSRLTMEATRFWERMARAEPEIFKLIDGWASHSYPASFRGSPMDSGRGSVRSFEWELSFLAKFGLRQNLPVFITETGWVHKESIAENQGKKVLGYSSEEVGNFIKQAFDSAWKDSRVVAVTPFVLNYQANPFDNFSWKKFGSTEFYPQYQAMQSWPKKKGKPIQIQDSKFVSSNLPDKVVQDSTYSVEVRFRNMGQSIWDSSTGTSLTVVGPFKKDSVVVDQFSIKPEESGSFQVSFETDSTVGVYDLSITLLKDGKPFGEKFARKIQVVAPPTLKVTAQPLFDRNDRYGFELKLLDNGRTVAEFDDLKLDENGQLTLPLFNVVPDRRYQFYFSKRPYLPGKVEADLSEVQTGIDFGRLVPLDLNGDQILDVRDLVEPVRHLFSIP